jgi:hypothetical protein
MAMILYVAMIRLDDPAWMIPGVRVGRLLPAHPSAFRE